MGGQRETRRNGDISSTLCHSQAVTGTPLWARNRAPDPMPFEFLLQAENGSSPTECWDIPLFLAYWKGNLKFQLLHLKYDINLGKKKNVYLFPHFCLRKNMLWGIKVVEER